MRIVSIKKRSGEIVPFDETKIAVAINKAFHSLYNVDYMSTAEKVAREVTEKLVNEGNDIPDVEHVQDLVEKALMRDGYLDVAKAYIIYRERRTTIRDTKNDLMKTYQEITFSDAKDSDVKRENANVDGNTAMGTMLKYGSEGAKMFFTNYITKPKFAEAHKNGDIHIHDMDFAPMGTTTCTQIDLLKLFDGGFSTGHGHLREPQDIMSYSALGCIAIQSNQNDQHGGQSVVNFDYAMAEGLKKSYKKFYRQNLAKALELFCDIEDQATPVKELSQKIENETGLFPSMQEKFAEYFVKERVALMEKYGITEQQVGKCQRFAVKYATRESDRASYQAMEALIHNLNTMHSRAGAQVPFSSINYGMDTSPEARMVIKNLLLATEAGLGNGETPIFPIQIFRVKEGINYNPGEPNYDLFKLAIRCSAKRLFPNFAFVDAPFNLQYYKPGHPETEIAYMGAVTGEDVITIRVDGKVMTLPFAVAYDKYANIDSVVEIMDRGKFVKIKAWQNYPDGGDWFDVKFSNGRYLRMTSDHPLPTLRGRVMCEDLVIGDEVPLADYDFSQPSIGIEETQPPCDPWVLGVLVCDGNRDAVVTLAMDEKDIADALVKKCGGRIHEQHRNEKGDYLEVFLRHGDEKFLSKNPMQEYFGSSVKRDRRLPEGFLTWSKENRRKLLAGIIDADGYLNNARGCHVQVGSTNKTLAIEEMQLAQSLGYDARMYKSTYGNGDAVRYQVSFRLIEDLPIVSSKKRAHVIIQKDLHRAKTVKVIGIDFLGTTGQRRYDVTTESDRFDVSGINSHNCRTRVIGNVYDPSREICNGRGNLSFTTINLPRLAIKANGDIDQFYKGLDEMLDLCVDQLLERFEFQKHKKVKNAPFLMGQGVWIDSDKLDWEDELGDILNHGTLSVGFIGLAEALKALIGVHHGESDEAQKLGLEIIGHMRKRMDDESQKRTLNFSLLATPEHKRALVVA